MLNEDIVVDESAANEDVTLEKEVAIENPETEENLGVAEEENPQDLNSEDLDLINSLLEDDTSIEEKPNEPTFFPKKENEEESADEFIDEELLEDIEKGFTELESELTTSKETISQKEKDLEESINTASAYADALEKLGDHPILGSLNAKILKGETVDIPEYLQKSLQDDLDALPNMEDIASEKPGVKPAESLQAKLSRQAKRRY